MARMSKRRYLDSLMPIWSRLNRRANGYVILGVTYVAVRCECKEARCKGWRLVKEDTKHGDC